MPKIAASLPAIKAPRRRCEPVYRVRNWPAYEAGLKQRGSLTFWITPQALRGWYYQGPTQRGSQDTFSDLAIQTAVSTCKHNVSKAKSRLLILNIPKSKSR